MNQSNSKHLKSSMKKSSCYEEKLMLMSVRKMKSKKVFVDKISELPDDILYFIISSLTLKEAARTGILSKRWRFLWMKCVSSTLSHNLDVLAMNTVPNPRNEIGDCLGGGGKFLESYSTDRLTLLPVESPNFLGFIYQILHLDHCCMKDSMTVRIYLDNNTVENIDQLKDMALAQRNDFAHNIDKWIKMAVAKQIDPSHFFIRRDIYRDGDRYYPFPCLFPAHETKPSLKFMGLRRCSVSSPVSNRLSSLTSIRIKHVVITDEIVTGILSHSHDLEKLTLSRCEGLLHLKIFGPSLKLKHLTILFCSSLTKVEVRAKYLTRLQYCGYSVEFMHMDVPTLCEVIIRNAHHDSRNALNYARENLSSDVPQLESLTLSLSPIEERKMTGQSAPFANLKKLMIQTFPGLFWGFIPLLQMSPYLRNFQLHVHRVDEKKGAVSEKPCNSPYPYLEEITLSGFIGSPHEIEFATYLLKNSPNLKKMTIFYDFLFYVSETNSLDRYGEEDVEKLAAKGPCILNMAEKESGVVEQLNNLQSPGIQILFI